MSKKNLPDIVRQIDMLKTADPTAIVELKKALINAWREVKTVEEQERTRREAIRALKEITMKKLYILEKC